MALYISFAFELEFELIFIDSVCGFENPKDHLSWCQLDADNARPYLASPVP